ncbi:MAG: T9SS type A sorting domain-containing protein, partial [Ginsengibacter sp.]
QSQPADKCGGYIGSADDDVWYQFTAKSTGTVIVTLNCGANFDGVLEVFKGDCGSLTSISCSDASPQGGNEQVTINALEGTVYKVRVYSFGSSLNDEGSFSVSSTGSALPISLVSFKGDRVGNSNVLTWSTATELNNKGFNVQYSFNGRDFNSLSFVASKVSSGNSSSVLNYQYADNKATGANEYYRLMQTDKDGRSNYSNVIMIKGGGINSLSLNAIYPNPAKNSLNLIITSPENKQINLVITDITGQTLSRKNYSVSAGGNNLDLDISNLPSGSYFIKAMCSDGCQTATSKFVKE